MNHLKTPFRLFFIAAALSALLFIGAWVLTLSGHLTHRTTLLSGQWHAHEMIFGYLGAVLAGFLLTATVHWTGQKTVEGKGLIVLLVLWLLARVIHNSNTSFPGSAGVELLFFAGTALAVGRAVVVAKRWRNLAFPILMGVMGVSDLLIHLATSGNIDPVWSPRAFWMSIDAVALMILIFGGRVVPLFTKSALSLKHARTKSALDYAGLTAVALLIPAHALAVSAKMESAIWAIAGLLTLVRLYGWNGSKTLRRPLLAVLHLGWLLVGLGMLLLSYSLYHPLRVPPSSAQHLLFIGGFGTLSLGMMARVALGHTGREKKANTITSIAFALMILAAILRSGAAWFGQESYLDLVSIAGVAWALSFLFFLVSFTPVLLTRRVDGKDG